MNVLPCAALLTLALLAAPALANLCHDPIDLNSTAFHGSTGHQDLGNGAVLSRHSDMDGHTNTVFARFRMEFCQSGRTVEIIYRGRCFGENNPFCDHAGLDPERSFEADPATIEATIVEMNASSQVYSLQEFNQRLEDLGARLQEPVLSEFESCTCAVFDPELRATKRSNRVRNSE